MNFLIAKSKPGQPAWSNVNVAGCSRPVAGNVATFSTSYIFLLPQRELFLVILDAPRITSRPAKSRLIKPFIRKKLFIF
jgi:hypothetical protein